MATRETKKKESELRINERPTTNDKQVVWKVCIHCTLEWRTLYIEIWQYENKTCEKKGNRYKNISKIMKTIKMSMKSFIFFHSCGWIYDIHRCTYRSVSVCLSKFAAIIYNPTTTNHPNGIKHFSHMRCFAFSCFFVCFCFFVSSVSSKCSEATFITIEVTAVIRCGGCCSFSGARLMESFI